MRLEDHIQEIPDFPKPGIVLCRLVEQAGGVVAGCAFVIELAFLNGREQQKDSDVRSLVLVDDE